MNGGRKAVAIGAFGAAAACAVVYRQALRVTARKSWPPPDDAVTPAAARVASETFRGRRPRDAALDFAWSTAATIEPWAEGANFFPRILADVEAARSSVHILMFGWREGHVGMRMADLLERKLVAGVDVRALVDGMGSRAYREAREMYTRLASAGAEIVVNDMLPFDRDGIFPRSRRLAWPRYEGGRVDHRKLFVIDGELAWIGGAGLEDHFESGGFHDVMVRVTGDVVRQAQAAFLTSFRAHGGELPDDLARYFPSRLTRVRRRSRLRR